MSDIAGELARVRGAFDQPTLTLLHRSLAPVVIAIFRSSFGRDTRSIPAPRLHDQVDAYLDELRLAGVPAANLPAGSGRDLCLKWMHGQWLVRSTADDGSEVYSLTSHAQDALALVTSLTRERASLSEHRISTILSAVRRFNTEVNPDRAARVSILDSEIERLTAERNRLLDGGELPQVSPDYMLEGYSELLQLIAALPSDFARVEEAFTGLRASILASFRAEERPAGEVIDDYLARADSLMAATPEGRAFEGAFALLRDEALLLQLREDLGALLAHPLASDILLDADRRELRGTVGLIRSGIVSVLARRSRVSAALREYIVTHDITRDRELDATLRQLDAELATWMKTAGPRATVPLELLPPRVEVTHLRERFHNAETEVGPPPLADVSEHRPDAVSLTELLAQGGPSLSTLRAELARALADPEPMTSLGALFDQLDPELRRPVEIFGLLHLATNSVGMDRHTDTETYRAVRPDGTERALAVPRVAPADAPVPPTDPDAQPPALATVPEENR
ncbi:DUF3375 domain-containing protein [Blastococcus sp. TF02A-35]|uniref:DUF3375 domain-containing protein n=1 Tax=Blastococcus sp. TF02A-35 TaxID=2559612 RepID=UPI001072FF8D|nr:DUF3375 domain-containing protein [Blastococcus sp. TF02A_35]TFV47156.1 DUF3375 domain-containing protein [Blastococcus sp. TF02A_35]